MSYSVHDPVFRLGLLQMSCELDATTNFEKTVAKIREAKHRAMAHPNVQAQPVSQPA